MPDSPDTAASAPSFPVVGIGASAGGLEAMTRLLRAMPTDDSMALVLVQHLDPKHESHLVEILGRETPLPVRQVRNGMRVQPRHVYVIPPNATMRLDDGSFRLAKRRAVGRPSLPVDEFLTSLAETRGPSAVGVVLSGNASDGMLGMRAIKAEGGITFAQDESAQFPGMPRASISAGAVDFVMPPEDIARELGRVAKHPYLRASTDRQTKPDGDTLQKIFGLVRAATGIDFNYYRQTTILRRLARRMAVNRSGTYSEYLALLRKTPNEVTALSDDFLISVTAFFRDPGIFERLSTALLPKMLKERPQNQNVRVWVPGCATGEEAYSLAICLAEAQDASRPVEVQVFATDVADKAIEGARRGVYEEGALRNVSEGRLRRFFSRVDGRYQVSQTIRDMCVFARQNIAADPPFSHLDILSCRNLLIYLEPSLQRRLFPLFHHVLRPTGYLVLGPAESAANFSDLFVPIDKRHRIFTKRVSGTSPGLPILLRQFGDPTRFGAPTRTGRETDLAPPDLTKEIDRLLIGRYAPPAVVVNSNLEIVHFRGKTGAFLEPPSGAANLSILAMAREGLLADLRAALHKARTGNQRVRKEWIRLRSGGGPAFVHVEVLPLQSESAAGRLYLVLFEGAEKRKEATQAGKPNAAGKEERGRLTAARKDVQRLAKELVSTKEYLQAVIEQHESTNEELKSANEEILSSNEELQSMNEELDTAKEELQSANEELTTLNEELQNRNAQLSRLNDDLVNLLHSVQIPIVMLGADGTVRRFTPAAQRLLNLLPGDVGRPIENIRPNIDLRDLPSMIFETVDTIVPKQHEIQDRDGRWYVMTILPYRTLENKIDGAVLSFTDIDDQKKAALLAENARDYADAIVETVPDPLLVLSEDLRVKRANDAFYRLFRTTEKETLGRSLLDLAGGGWDIPELRARLAAGSSEIVEIEKVFDRIGRRVMLLRARWARFGIETAGDVILAFEDVTARRREERELRSSEAQYRDAFESPSESAMLLDADTGVIGDVNRHLTELLGIPREDFIGRKLWELPFVSGAESLERQIEEASSEGKSPVPGGLSDIVLRGAGGQVVVMEAVQRASPPGASRRIALTDVSQRRRLEQELRHVQKMESIGQLAGGMAHDFNNILNIISAHAESLKRGDPSRVADGADAIARSVARGAGVVRQLLTFARKDEATFRALSANDVVREATLIVGETFPKTVRVSTDLAGELPDVMADADQLHQALLNLLVNARDAMRGGGELRLTTRRVDQKDVRELHPEATAQAYVRIEVADDGHGMDAETRARIFEPFFTTKERGVGSGMGLTVVYGVMSSHRGFIDVESETGRGTTFRLYFPAFAGRLEPSSKRRRRTGPAIGGSETILFVEDEKMLLDSIAELLTQEGYTVMTARTGEEAVERYRQDAKQIALVVTDVELPQMSGWDAFGKILAADPNVRAVMVSGYLDPPMRARMMQGGAKGFLRKPYTLDEMLRTIREVLDESGDSPKPSKPRK